MILWSPDSGTSGARTNFDVNRRGSELNSAPGAAGQSCRDRGGVALASVTYDNPVITGQVVYRPLWSATASADASVLGFEGGLAYRYAGSRRTVMGTDLNSLPPCSPAGLPRVAHLPLGRDGDGARFAIDNVIGTRTGMLVDFPCRGACSGSTSPFATDRDQNESTSCRLLLALAAMFTLAACGDDGTAPDAEFLLEGTPSDPGILLAGQPRAGALHGADRRPGRERGAFRSAAASAVTPVGFSVSGNYAAVPLGNAASVAYINLATETVDRYFTFASGNATGSAFVNASTVVVCNQTTDQCGKFDPAQAGNEVTNLVTVTQFPTNVVATGGRAFVVSSNLDDSYMVAGPGVVTEAATRPDDGRWCARSRWGRIRSTPRRITGSCTW